MAPAVEIPPPAADAAGNCKTPEVGLLGAPKAGPSAKGACASLVVFAYNVVVHSGVTMSKTGCDWSALCLKQRVIGL